MAAGEVFPIINCADLARTRRWYERVFSAEVTYQYPEDDPEFVTLRVGSGQIGLGVGTVPALYGETPLPASGHRVDLCIYLDDLDVIPSAGAEMAVPPSDTPWGERVAYVEDPEGTMLLVIQQAEDDVG